MTAVLGYILFASPLISAMVLHWIGAPLWLCIVTFAVLLPAVMSGFRGPVWDD